MNLYVTNLNYETDEADLRMTFGRYGEVVRAYIVKDKATGRSQGYGFVEMVNAAQARAAVENLSGAELDGRAIKVQPAREKSEQRSTYQQRRRA